MPRKIRELEADLLREGAQMTPGKGSHRKYTHPLISGYVSVSGKPGADAQNYQERDVRDFIRRIRAVRGGRQP